MRYWVMRTDRSWAQQLIHPELRAGRLRQGWGSSPAESLSAIADKLHRGEALDGSESASWRRNRRLLPGDDSSVSTGDLLLLPHLPREGRWSLARAGGRYWYDVSPLSGDHGHVREAELCVEDISPWSRAVTAQLRRTMRCQLPLWNADHLARDIDQLEAADDLQAPADRERRLEAVMAAAEAAASEEMLRQFAAAELEGPIGTLLAYHYDVVDHVAGPAEHGADFVCFSRSPLGFAQVVAVQVKAWQGLAYDTEVFHQLRRAKSRWPAMTAGLVLTTAESTSEEFVLAAASTAVDINAEIRILCRSELIRLLLEAYLNTTAPTGSVQRRREQI